jgi:hypothetical protein
MHRLKSGLVVIVGFSLGLWSSPAAAEPRARLFQLDDAETSAFVGAHRIAFCAPRGRETRTGTEFDLVSADHWRHGIVSLTSLDAHAVRFLGRGSYGLAVARRSALAGIDLHPLSLEGGLVLSVLNLDVIDDDWSLAMFWPGATACASIKLGPITLSAVARSEYWWRWFGRDRYATSVGVMLGLLQKPVRLRAVHRR